MILSPAWRDRQNSAYSPSKITFKSHPIPHLPFHVSRFTFHVSRFTFSRFTFHLSRLTFPNYGCTTKKAFLLKTVTIPSGVRCLTRTE